MKGTGCFKLYFSFYSLLLCLATLLLKSYDLRTEEYIDAILYVQSDLLFSFPLFMAVFMALKLSTLIMLGNLIAEAFSSGNALCMVRLGVPRYYLLQVLKVTGAVAFTTLESVLLWFLLSSFWFCSVLKIISYIMLMSGFVLFLNMISTFMNYNLVNVTAAIIISCIFFMDASGIRLPLFCIAAVSFYSIVNILLLKRIRNMDYL